MAQDTTSRIMWLAQSAPLFGLLCYVAYQWRNLLSTILLIGALYSFIKNIMCMVTNTKNIPRTAFFLLVFFDVWIGLVKLSRYILLDLSYSRSLLDGVMMLTRKCPTTEVSIHKINTDKENKEGSEDVEVYVYKPETVSNKGCVVYIHGGGWCYLSARGFNTTVSYMAHYLEMVVVSVEYRLAPEHPFPAGLIDCYSAVQWVMDNSDMLGVEKESVFVAGDSAGGNLSATVSLLYRDRKGAPLDATEGDTRPPLAGQILLYPVVQGYSNSHFSMMDNSAFFPPPALMPETISLYAAGNDRFFKWFGNPQKTNKVPKFWKTVVKDSVEDNNVRNTLLEAKKLAPLADDATFEEVMGNSYILPLHAEDLTNLPPAYVLVASADTLRDEGEWYARYLEQSGNTVVFSEIPHVHGSMMNYRRNRVARNELMKIKKFIGQHSKCSCI